MEDGPLTLDEGTTEVQRLLVEPENEHVSMDSVLCYNEKIPENCMKREEASCCFAELDYGVAQEGIDVTKQVLDVMPSEVEAGYLHLPNDFCSMGEDYFSGIEFDQSITNLDYSLSEGLHISLSEGPIPGSSSGANTSWRSDLLAITDVTEVQNNRVNLCSSEISDICIHQESKPLVEEKPLEFPTSSSVQNISNLQNMSSHSPHCISSDEDCGNLLPSGFTSGDFCSSKIQEDREFGLLGQNVESNSFSSQDELAKISTPANTDAHTTSKRSRRPTRRYIDELVEPISKQTKKKQEVSISTPNSKALVVKNRKKCQIESRRTRISAEEDSSVIAIQVPFGSLVNKESQKSHSSNTGVSSDNENSMGESEDAWATAASQKKRCGLGITACEKKCNDFTAVNQKKGSDYVISGSQKKRDHRVASVSQKKRDDCVRAVSQRKREDNAGSVSQKKQDDFVTPTSQKRRDDRLTAVSQKKRDDHVTAVGQKKRDDHVTAVRRPEVVSSRRKHHRLWTISEVRKLIDGVSQYGVGRWSRIKKLLFSTSPHRTSVDLKDKWRNLLKASGLQEQGTNQTFPTFQGEKKRNLAWRPLPKSILRRVCELAAIYPYPNGRKPKIINNGPSDRSTDITLSDYRRILRSINGN